MHYFMIEVTPTAENPAAKELGGAYVGCWINFLIEDGAELLARHYLQQEGWVPGEVEERRWVTPESYEPGSDALSHYLEAEADGACFVFHTWDANAEDA